MLVKMAAPRASPKDERKKNIARVSWFEPKESIMELLAEIAQEQKEDDAKKAAECGFKDWSHTETGLPPVWECSECGDKNDEGWTRCGDCGKDRSK